MKKEKVESIFCEELSKIKYELVGTLTDLKLHSIVSLDTFDEDLFYEFCISNFNDYTENLIVEFKYVKNSSKFRIDYKNGLYGNVYYYEDFVNASKKIKMKMLFEECAHSEHLQLAFLEDNEIEESYIQEKIESYVGNLKTIVDTYKEIEDFKDRQIELWNEFIRK